MMIIKENIIIKGVISVTSKLVYLYKNTTIKYNIVRFTRENRINALFLVPLFKIQNNLCIGIKRNKITPMRNDDVDPIKACAYGSYICIFLKASINISSKITKYKYTKMYPSNVSSLFLWNIYLYIK